MNEHVIILFYKFVRVADPEALRDAQRELCEKFGIKGRLLIAKEGVNGTFEGTRDQIEAYKMLSGRSPNSPTVFMRLKNCRLSALCVKHFIHTVLRSVSEAVSKYLSLHFRMIMRK